MIGEESMKEKMWRIKYLKILEILKQESDIDRPITTNDLLCKLQERGVHVDRKVLYDDIKILNEAGYEIFCERRKQNQYYILDRQFNVPELRVLMDATLAATFISETKTAELLDKIANLGGSYRKRLLLRNNNYFDTNKHTNPHIYYSINEIEEAINRNKKISFKYLFIDEIGKKCYKKNGAEYIVNPVATVFSNDNYYLISSSDKYDDFTHYRIDRMDECKLINEDRTKVELNSSFKIGEYRKQHFGMFSGNTKRITLEFDIGMVDVMHDKFGENIPIIKKNDKYFFTTDVAVSKQFYGYILGLGDGIKIISPKNIVDDFKNYVSKILNLYDE